MVFIYDGWAENTALKKLLKHIWLCCNITGPVTKDRFRLQESVLGLHLQVKNMHHKG